ncbi:hypothetical protein [Salipiger mucosus]|uniref:Uncharacterized protein n=1 Tax=Salipiger mucosus DSM 16094 TaxID=1123237 RepID=S9QFP6_9RHOB|nr:hypothetical protein [Salipiger mucosus]EPX78438.1 hypothetical protein Salmuc_03548 [Salipiger mucosus DSM 16094]
MRAILLAIGLGFVAQASAAQSCSEIRFARGASSGEVSGYTIDGEPRCYTFGSGAGQTATVELFSTGNACFTIAGVVDCRAEYRFTTNRQTYRIGVYQLLRSPSYEEFRLRLTIY